MAVRKRPAELRGALLGDAGGQSVQDARYRTNTVVPSIRLRLPSASSCAAAGSISAAAMRTSPSGVVRAAGGRLADLAATAMGRWCRQSDTNGSSVLLPRCGESGWGG